MGDRHHPPASAYNTLESAQGEPASIQPPPLRSTPSGKPEIDGALYPEQTMHPPQADGLCLRDLEYLHPDSHLSCPICHITFIDPVSVQCGHYFCAECLAEYWTMAQKPRDRLPCPACRTRVTSTTSAPRVIINMCNDVNVKCPSDGCGKIMARGDLQTHVRRYCMERAIPCLDQGCKKKMKRKHSVLGLCSHVTHTECACGDLVLSEEMELHHRFKCPLRKAGCIHCQHPITHLDQATHECEREEHCPGQDFGCDVSLTPAALEEHAKTCTMAKMAPYLRAHVANSLAPLQKQLTQSQQRVQGLEEGMDKLFEAIESATQALKQSRRDASHTPNTQSPPSDPPTPNLPISTPHHHLLALHENLRATVTELTLNQRQLGRRVDESHAHSSLICTNDRLRLEEQLSVLSNALFSTRAQLQWLLNREKGQQQQQQQQQAKLRGRGVAASATIATAVVAGEESGVGVIGIGIGNGNKYPAGGTGAPSSAAGLPLRPARRTSGGGSQERVKL